MYFSLFLFSKSVRPFRDACSESKQIIILVICSFHLPRYPFPPFRLLCSPCLSSPKYLFLFPVLRFVLLLPDATILTKPGHVPTLSTFN